MTRAILALPVDGRPVTCDQVALLAESAGWRLLLPPRDRLGRMRAPGDRDRLAAWLLDTAGEAAGLVLSIDMLVYGGLVPSRLSNESEEALAARLDVLRELRRRHPRLPIVAFAATMRISNNDHAEEERPYWADHGSAIWRWSHHRDRHAVLGEPADERAAAALEERIPAAVLRDYRTVRARNVAITARVLDLAAAGAVDFVVLPQDDTAPFGVNVAERRALVERAGRLGIADRVASFPGADEVIWTQVARLIAQAERLTPRFALDWSEPAAATALVARYEDRPIGETVAAQVAAVGGVVTTDRDDEDAVALFLHTAGAEQGEWALDLWPDGPRPGVNAAWLDRLASRLDTTVALVDLANANGGDPATVAALGDRAPLDRLRAYAGWNTAGNSIGSAVAICAVPLRDARAHRRLLATRFVDDLVYQAGCRQEIRAAGVDVATPGGAAWALDTLFRPRADAWLAANGFGDLAVGDAWFPWDRTFEIGFTIGTRS